MEGFCAAGGANRPVRVPQHGCRGESLYQGNLALTMDASAEDGSRFNG